MFEFIKGKEIIGGISKGVTKSVSSVAGYVKSVDYRSKFVKTKDAVSGLFTKPEPLPEDLPAPMDVVGCVGKLPVYADFIRDNLCAEEALILDKWVQTGFAHLSKKRMETFKQMFSRFPHCAFILFGNDSVKAVSGVMVPGKDQSGREYPFVIFKVIGENYSSKHISLLPLMLSDFRQFAFSLCDEDWASQDKDTLFARINGLPRNEFEVGRGILQNSATGMLEIQTASSFWEVLLPGSGAPQHADFIRTFNLKINELINLLPEQRNMGIEIMIPDMDDADTIQLFFVSLVEKMFESCEWRGQSWVTDFDEKRGRLVLFFRPIETVDFLTLVDREAGLGNVHSITALMGDEESAFVEELQLLENPSSTLADLKDQWVRLQNPEPVIESSDTETTNIEASEG